MIYPGLISGTQNVSQAQAKPPPSSAEPATAGINQQNLITNLCSSIPQLPPQVFASLQALGTIPQLQPQGSQFIPNLLIPPIANLPLSAAMTAGGGGCDPTTKALLDHLVAEQRLYRCEHCNILFPEISLYIFHRGCHGQSSPFQCHFCHTIFREKFEFMAHFMFCVHSKK